MLVTIENYCCRKRISGLLYVDDGAVEVLSESQVIPVEVIHKLKGH